MAQRSIELPTATIQFHVCPPSVRELPGWKPAGVIAAIKRWGKFARFIRVKFELKKNGIYDACLGKMSNKIVDGKNSGKFYSSA